MSILYIRNSDGIFTPITTVSGSPGKPGYTPVAGVDYFTDADKQAIIDAVLATIAPPYTNLATTISPGYGLGTSGEKVTRTEQTLVEDYIPFAVGDVIRIKGLNFTDFTNSVAFYNSSKTCLAVNGHTYPGTNGSKTIAWERESTDVYKYTNESNTDCALARFAGVRKDGVDIVITVNEPI